MTEQEEQIWLLGNRAAWSSLLDECLRRLGYDNPKSQIVSWISEREAIIARLRIVCGEFGDNDWDESLHLADVIEKHLENYLYE